MRLTLRTLLIVLSAACITARGRKCRPESRCVNSPDQGLSQDSEFLPLDNFSATALEVYYYQDGMARYAMPGTRRCLYGHTDVANSRKPNNEATQCGSTGWGCGYRKHFEFCTCVSRERALDSYNPDGLKVGGGILIGSGILILLVWILQTMRDRERNRYHGDGGLWPTCEPEQRKMWGLLLCLLLLPLGCIGGGVAMILQANRPAEDIVEYWHGKHSRLRRVLAAPFVFFGCGSPRTLCHCVARARRARAYVSTAAQSHPRC